MVVPRFESPPPKPPDALPAIVELATVQRPARLDVDRAPR